MKRILLSILTLIYITTATGASINLHQCMGKIVDWSLIKEEQRHCGKCGMEQSDSNKKTCCKEEQKLVKLERDQSVHQEIIKIAAATGHAIIPNHFITNETLATAEAVAFPVSNAPPVTQKVDACILYCTFLI
jgi:hypothetical protein